MKSSGSVEPLDLDRDLPTAPEDIAALRKLRGRPRLDFDGYLRFLASFDAPSAAELRARRGPRGDRPFDLIR
jgi:hypothetical protein